MLLWLVMRRICYWSPEYKRSHFFQEVLGGILFPLSSQTHIYYQKTHLAMELDNNIWKNAACCPRTSSQHSYEKFHVNCVNFSLEIRLVTDGGRKGKQTLTAFYNQPAQNIIINSLYAYNIFHTCTLHSDYGRFISLIQL